MGKQHGKGNGGQVLPYPRIVKKLKCIIFTAFTVSPLPAPHLAIRRPIAHTHSHEETTNTSGGMIYGLEATTSIYHRLCR